MQHYCSLKVPLVLEILSKQEKKDYCKTCTTCNKKQLNIEVYMHRRFSTVLPDEITIVHRGDNQTLCF